MFEYAGWIQSKLWECRRGCRRTTCDVFGIYEMPSKTEGAPVTFGMGSILAIHSPW